MLRMVLDCSPQHLEQIQKTLADYRQKHGICYDLFKSPAALMTCYTPAFADGQHVHFIDGADGGYAMAAKQLKAQLKEDLAKN